MTPYYLETPGGTYRLESTKKDGATLEGFYLMRQVNENHAKLYRGKKFVCDMVVNLKGEHGE